MIVDNRQKHDNPIRERLYEIIFEADTPGGKMFDVALLIAIVVSVIVVMLETTNNFGARYHDLLLAIEWILTIFFTVEYLLRLYCVLRPWKYATSFFGIVDLLAILPTYLSIFLAGSQSLLVIRVLRLIRVFRIFKLANYMRQGRIIMLAMRRSAPKIAVFILFVTLMVVIIGSIMYLVEGGVNEQFDSIPRSIYWAIVTLTTVGYGDISPVTDFGQFLAALVMMLGYSVIAVPTGIVTVEFSKGPKAASSGDQSHVNRACHSCGKEGHEYDANFCKFCGAHL
ncbi:MAG: ion transporter [Saprospiraceae bacterium]|nr:ion transporter [Saprospiraceae bacterium]